MRLNKEYRIHPELTTFDFLLARASFGFPIYVYQAIHYKVKIFEYKERFWSLIGAALGCWGVITLELFSYKFISGTKGLLILDANPILTALLGYLILGDFISRYDIASLAIMLVGGYFLTLHDDENEYDESNKTIGYICLFITLVIASGAFILIKRVSSVLHFVMYPLYTSVWFLISTFCIWLFTKDVVNVEKYTKYDIFLLLNIGLGSLFGQLFMSIGFIYLDVTFFSLFLNSQIVLVFIVEVTFWGYSFALSDYTGAFCILVAIFISIWVRK